MFFYKENAVWNIVAWSKVSMPSRAYISFLRQIQGHGCSERKVLVSMPSRAYISFLRLRQSFPKGRRRNKCQCPLGLISHFYPHNQYYQNIMISMYQCPLGLISHFYGVVDYVWAREDKHLVSMPSRAYISFLRYPFKNLGFMRLPEPVFAGIYQNILTTAVFRAC